MGRDGLLEPSRENGREGSGPDEVAPRQIRKLAQARRPGKGRYGSGVIAERVENLAEAQDRERMSGSER